MSLTVGARQFLTVSAFEAHFKAIRDRYPLGATVSGMDVEDLRGLVAFNGLTEEPVRFVVGNNKWGKRCFIGINRDGSRFPLSASRASRHAKASGETRAKAAFRLLGRNETKLVRNRLSGLITCHRCGRAVQRGELEMDHYPETLDALITRFLASKGLSISEVNAVDEGEGKIALEDGALRGQWMAFHRTEAELKPAHKTCNRRGASNG